MFNRITDLHQLEDLYLSWSGISDREFRTICRLKNLKRLNVDGCEDITDRAFSHLSRLRSLRELHASDCGIGKQGLKAIRLLKRTRGGFIFRSNDPSLVYGVGLR